jgi:hypothetical protein
MGTPFAVALLIFFIASLIPDLANIALNAAVKEPRLSPQLKGILGGIKGYPWRAFLFGITFALACKIAGHQRKYVNRGSILPFALLAAAFQWLALLIVVFLTSIIKDFPVSPIPIGTGVFLLLLVACADELLEGELGLETALIVAALGAGLVFADDGPKPWSIIGMFDFTAIGMTMGFFYLRN